LLQQVADRLKRHLDSTELLAHFGGGTFGLIMEAAGDEDEAVHWMQEQVVEMFRAPFNVDGRGIPVDVKAASRAIRTTGTTPTRSCRMPKPRCAAPRARARNTCRIAWN
jgi:GGDEF domain-containing protein